jgi:sortase (surface protein transpeptidase)
MRLGSIAGLLRRRPSRIIAAVVLFVGSGILLGAGLAGFLLSGDSDDSPPEAVYRGPEFPTPVDGLGTATATPVPTPPPSDAPIGRMLIDKLGVDAPVITLGLDENAVPLVPSGPYEVAWYDFSPKPGWGGNAVFSGHVDWTINGQYVVGVFYSLSSLELGDEIKVVLEDGTEYVYKVTINRAIPYDDPQALEVMGPTPEDSITLITCGGTWMPQAGNPLGGNYTHRQVVRGELARDEEASTVQHTIAQ